MCPWKKNAPRCGAADGDQIIPNSGPEVTTSHARSSALLFVCFLTLSLSVDLTQGWTEIVFAFSLSKRKTHYRIYEKTHVDLYNHFKPEGMHILSVKLTFLLSLIGVTRGEWRGNLSVVVSCLRKLREKNHFYDYLVCKVSKVCELILMRSLFCELRLKCRIFQTLLPPAGFIC